MLTSVCENSQMAQTSYLKYYGPLQLMMETSITLLSPIPLFTWLCTGTTSSRALVPNRGGLGMLLSFRWFSSLRWCLKAPTLFCAAAPFRETLQFSILHTSFPCSFYFSAFILRDIVPKRLTVALSGRNRSDLKLKPLAPSLLFAVRSKAYVSSSTSICRFPHSQLKGTWLGC